MRCLTTDFIRKVRTPRVLLLCSWMGYRRLTCRRGRELLHVDDVMYVVAFEYVVFFGLEVALQPVHGGRKLLGVDARVERLVRQHQADREVLLPASGHDARHGGRRLPAEPLRAGSGGHRRGGGRQFHRFLQPVLEHTQPDGALAAHVPGATRPPVHRPVIDLYARPVPRRPAVDRGRSAGAHGHGHGHSPPPPPPAPPLVLPPSLTPPPLLSGPRSRLDFAAAVLRHLAAAAWKKKKPG